MGPFKITGTATFTVQDQLGPYGPTNVAWSDDSYCECTKCQVLGLVEDFKIKESEPSNE